MKAGISPDVILAGVVVYDAYVKASRTEARFIKTAATFFGPDDHYATDYTHTEPEGRGAAVLRMAAEADAKAREG